jgi:hypothetical protein
VAKLALRCHAVFEALRKSFEFLVLHHQFVILDFLLGNSLTEHGVSFPQTLSVLHLRLLISSLLIDGCHQLLVHFTIFFKLLLGELKLLLKMLFLFFPDLLLLVDTRLVEVDYLLEFLFILYLHFVVVSLAEFLIALVFFWSLDLDYLGLGL